MTLRLNFETEILFSIIVVMRTERKRFQDFSKSLYEVEPKEADLGRKVNDDRTEVPSIFDRTLV